MRVVIVRNSSPQCEPTCPEWIAAEGEIMARTPQLFRKVFKQMGKRKLPVILRSPGGSINAAVEIGQMIRKRGLITGVSNTVYRGCSPFDKNCKLPDANNGVYDGSLDEMYAFCNSACPMILAGGVERYAGAFSSIGVHEPKTVWTREQVRYRETYKMVRGKKKVVSRKIIGRKQLRDKVTYGLDKRLRRQLTQHYQSLGINLAILDDTVKAKYSDIHIVADQRLDDLNIRTSPKAASSLASPMNCLSNERPLYCVTVEGRAALTKEAKADKPVPIAQDMPNMTFRLARLAGVACRESCPTWIAATGVIGPDTAQQLEAFLQARGLRRLVVALDAQGADMKAAIALGKVIQKSGLETVVAATDFVSALHLNTPGGEPARLLPWARCSDACALAFAGGVKRMVSRTAIVTLHHPSAYEVEPQSNARSIMMTVYLATQTVSSNLMAELHEIKRDSVKIFNGAMLLTLKLATDVVDLENRFSESGCNASPTLSGCVTADRTPNKTVGAQIN